MIQYTVVGGGCVPAEKVILGLAEGGFRVRHPIGPG